MGAPSSIETLLAAALLAILLSPLLVAARRLRRRGLAVALVAVWLAAPAALVGAVARFRVMPAAEHEIRNRPVEVQETGYTTSDTCKACHPREYATWHRSYHRTMTQVVGPETVLADFDDVELEIDDHLYRLSTDGEKFWVEMDSPGWNRKGPAPRVRNQVVLSTGSHNEQDYWVEVGADRRVMILPFAWKIREQRWVPFRSVFIRPPSEDLYDEPGLWNRSCQRCHSTRPDNSAVNPGEIFATEVTEFGIACEACHGPAEEHVRLNRSPLRRMRYYLSSEPDESIVNPAKLSHERSSEVCAFCHAETLRRDAFPLLPGQIRGELTHGTYRPGDDLNESLFLVRHRSLTDPSYEPTNERERLMIDRLVEENYSAGRFWADGMIRISGRDFNGTVESPCFERGELECLSCHQLHQESDDPRPISEWAVDMLAPGMDSDAACLQCHGSFADAISIVDHTHHSPDSAGSSCYNCHMPHTIWGVQKAIRSHHIDSPDVNASLETGRPNACNQCHLDRTLAWTADRLENWYGIPSPELTDDQRTIAASVLWALEGNAGQRALMAWSMGWESALEASGSTWIPPILSQLLADPYDTIRFVAFQSLRKHDGFADFEYEPIDPRPDTLFQARVIWDAAPSLREGLDPQAVLRTTEGQLLHSELRARVKERDDTPMELLE